jgi:NADH-quinone oxidoreductase subunit C
MSAVQLSDFKGIEDYLVGSSVYAGELTLEVKPSTLVKLMKGLKSHMGYSYLADITGIDYYTDEKRFGVAYNLVNLVERKRLRILVRVDEKEPTVDSVVDVWKAANWFEREVWDMVGIRFHGHPDHRRIYMPEDFDYHPLRKEFPLIGIPGSIQLPEPAPPKEYK